MINLRKYLWLLIALCLPLGLVACSDSDDPLKPVVRPDDGEDDEQAYQDEKAYANFFAFNVMNDYYLWKKEIATSLSVWQVLENPIEAIAKYRYKDAQGQDIDKWTLMTDKYTEMVGSTDGVSTGTYGLGLDLYRKAAGSDAVVAFVTYTYAGSPAEEAGLKRGDVILEVDGAEMNVNNYSQALFESSSVEVGVGHYNSDGTYSAVEKTVAMQAKVMYEDPIVKHDVFDCGGKKVGYLAYTSFTFQSSEELYELCKEFKKQGIEELILDLRYNGGGYVFTEEVLASMLAPEAEVKAKSIFQTEIWNDDYMAYYEQEGVDLNTYFSTEFRQKHNDKLYDFNTSDANLGLSKIYALVTENSASASEGLLVGLMPYMDIEIIGQQTHGKYCAGIMLKGAEWYQDVVDMYKANKQNFAKQYPEFADWNKHIADWGIYVMVSTYADKDGKNPCMPDGLTPHVTAEDRIEEPYPLGDEREAMLNLALQRAGKTDVAPRPESRSAAVMPSADCMLPGKKSPLDGKLILTGIRLSPRVVDMK